MSYEDDWEPLVMLAVLVFVGAIVTGVLSFVLVIGCKLGIFPMWWMQI